MNTGDDHSPGHSRREPIPPGAVSTIRGIIQIPVLKIAIQLVLLLALASLLLPGTAGAWCADAAIGLLIAVPLVRVAWLIYRWRMEADRRFITIGTGLILVISCGALIALLGS
jgi:hypothetical protein